MMVHRKYKNTDTTFIQNHKAKWAHEKINHSWCKSSLANRDSNVFKWRTLHFLKKVFYMYVFPFEFSKNLGGGILIILLKFFCCWRNCSSCEQCGPWAFLAQLSQTLKWAFLITICPLSVVVVKFSHFLLLQNQWANFNQTWHQAS